MAILLNLVKSSQVFSEHLHQADLSMLALREVADRVLVILSGSFTSQIEMGRTLMDHSPSDASYILTPNIMPPGIEPAGCADPVLTHGSLVRSPFQNT